jgi:subtilisin family serine protease
MKKISALIFIISCVLNSLAQDYAPRKIIIKVKQEFSSKCSNSIISIPEINMKLPESTTLEKKFPKHKTVPKSIKNSIDLSTIYELQFSEDVNIYKIIKELKNSGFIEYAEPKYINKLCYSPNDSLNQIQYYLDAIKAYQAWDINKGDSSIVIAIVDTGTDLDHPDLIDNLALNFADTINGIDDDNDGFIDNFYGWNTASDTNFVGVQNVGHGTNVAGIAAASTDNHIGISGVGFNTKFLTVRIDLPTGFLNNAYEGIVYAADHGADIINCSWGGNFSSEYARDIVKYATYNKGALIVAGAGNFGNEIPFYPAAYKDVIAVGATIEGDTVKLNSNYGHWLDIFAPGESMYTCNAIGKYGFSGGTSMASPLVSACAAIIKAEFPHYSPQQLRHKLKISSDKVEHLSPSQYAGKMGSGRVNLFKALSQNNLAAIEFINPEFYGNNNSFNNGDTIFLSGDFINYLASTNSVFVNLEGPTNKIKIINPLKDIGTINNLDTINIKSQPFKLKVLNSTSNENIELTLKILVNGIVYKQYINLRVNKDYITISENDITVSLTSSGGIGYSGDQNELGEGFKYKNSGSLLYEGSFALGNSSNFLLDKFRNASGAVDSDFKIATPIDYQVPKKANVELKATFNDGGFSLPQGLEISQYNYVFRSGIGQKSIIYVFEISNKGISNHGDLYAGLFLDWDILDANKNRISSDSTRRMGITYTSDSSIFCSIKLLTENINFNHYAIDNVVGGDGFINALDGLSDLEKYNCLSTNRDSAGYAGSEGNDVIDVLSAGPFDLKVDSSISISFLLSVNENLTHLQQETDSMQLIFNQLAISIEETNTTKKQTQLYPNPAKDKITSSLVLSNKQYLEIKILNMQGQLIFEKTAFYQEGINQIEMNTNSLENGVYFLYISGENLKYANKFVISGK